MRLTQGVSKESRIRACRDQQRSERRVGEPFERETPEDSLDPIELPVFDEARQAIDVGIAGPGIREFRDLDRLASLHCERLDMAEIRQGHEATGEAEGARDLD